MKMSLFLAVSLRLSVPQRFLCSSAKERVGSDSSGQIEEQRLEKPWRDPKLFAHFAFFITPAAVSAWVGTFSLSQEKKKRKKMCHELSPANRHECCAAAGYSLLRSINKNLR